MRGNASHGTDDQERAPSVRAQLVLGPGYRLEKDVLPLLEVKSRDAGECECLGRVTERRRRLRQLVRPHRIRLDAHGEVRAVEATDVRRIRLRERDQLVAFPVEPAFQR